MSGCQYDENENRLANCERTDIRSLITCKFYDGLEGLRVHNVSLALQLN